MATLGDGDREGGQVALRLYRTLSNLWLERAESQGWPQVDLEEFVLEGLLGDQHLFWRRAELVPFSQLRPQLVQVMEGDLLILQQLARAPLARWVETLCRIEIPQPPPPVTETRTSVLPWEDDSPYRRLKERMRQEQDWSALVECLADFAKTHKCGLFRGVVAWRLSRCQKEQARLRPIEHFAAFALDWLEGNGERLKIIETNVQHLIQGYRGHNTLVWGPRGCGKSSLLRGLIGKYYARGLRGIEIGPEVYSAIPELFEIIRGRPEYFMAVLDNISLDPHDPTFRTLSSVMEGGLEQRPDNLIFCATSNFKDLVDRRGERPEGLGRMQLDEDLAPAQQSRGIRPAFYDPQQQERLDEQRGLDDRFALKVFIDLPKKSQYEGMVLSYARRAGIDVDETELLAAFNVWRQRHNHDLVGGRTARDFILAQYPQASLPSPS